VHFKVLIVQPDAVHLTGLLHKVIRKEREGPLLVIEVYGVPAEQHRIVAQVHHMLKKVHRVVKKVYRVVN
jgi:mevalonate kinase